MREMPLQMMNEILSPPEPGEDEGEDLIDGDSEDGFELYGDNNDIAVYMCLLEL